VKNLSEAIYNKFTGSAFSTSVGGRLYKHRTKQSPTWPYAVYYLITDVPIDTFTENLEDVTVQFSIFSQATSSTEIEGAFANLIALYDNCVLTIADGVFFSMQRLNGTLTSGMMDTVDGTGEYWQYDVDYEIIYQRI
jgi:hypothetical protein